ncbi:MAG: enoyl-CoA hydratase/isomerase family protein [Deltaproteobacteria bacterium]|nr:MAG: enoyl-CoA hydratase/isomerase family protein [Deltaproteobacteria bacterium]
MGRSARRAWSRRFPVSDTVLLERRGGVALVTLNRPNRMNALTDELMTTLPVRLKEVADDPEVRCVVLTGAGDRAFSAGADLAPGGGDTPNQQTLDEPLETSIDRLKRYHEAPWLLHTMPKPTLAAINGAAAGASLSLALACDLRVAAEGAVLTTAFARIGFSGDYGGAFFMTQLVGTAKARELYLLGERIDAEEALRIGLVHRVFPKQGFRKEAEALALQIAEGPPLAYRYMKRNLNLALTTQLRDILDLEAEAMMRTGRSEDLRTGVLAFLKKEKPRFQGR